MEPIYGPTNGRAGLLSLLVAVSLLLGACTQENPAIESSPAEQDEMSEADQEDRIAEFGEPGDPAEADRTIEVDMVDALRFEPEELDVQVGQTVTFVLINRGEIVHEFVIGDEEYQQDHADEMMEMMEEGAMDHEHLPNALDVAPGETGELTWTFTQEGELLYGCHEPGHYQGGMVGTINVSS